MIRSDRRKDRNETVAGPRPIPNFLIDLVEKDADKRRRYVRRVEKLGWFRQLLVLLRSDVGVSFGSLDSCHVKRNGPLRLWPLSLLFVRLEWLIQDIPSRPCIGWRVWVYGTPRAMHFDLTLRLGAAR